MKSLLSIAIASANARRFGLGIVALSIALSTFLLLTVERVRHDVRLQFAQSVSGTDLIVGPRGSSVSLLLYAVFRLGNATNNIGMASVEAIARDPAVAWVVPLSLGDSHRGYPVVATTKDYFTRFRYGSQRNLALAQGRAFSEVYDVVLGAEVAERLRYRLGDRVVLAHGDGAIAGTEHADKPFTVVGILGRTGTPVDRSLHIDLRGMEALHVDWIAGMPLPGRRIDAAKAAEMDLAPQSVTAALVGLKSRAAVFSVQRMVADYEDEPLSAVLPGVALDELWGAVGVGERALLVMSALVGVVSLAGLVAVIVTGLEQRRRELAVLRAVGAAPRHVLGLLLLEGVALTALGVLAGVVLWAVALGLAGPWVQGRWGLGVTAGWPRASEWYLLLAVIVAGALASLLPGWRAYRMSLADGLAPRS